VTSALRVTDGALLVVDCLDGVAVQTETVLRQALEEKIKPVVVINKVDRAISELGMSKEELYKKFESVLNEIDGVLENWGGAEVGMERVRPEKGELFIGSGLQGEITLSSLFPS
jgi:elongation factor 2